MALLPLSRTSASCCERFFAEREAALVDRRAQRLLERGFHVAQQNAILRALGTCHARLHVGEIEFQRVGEDRVGRIVGAEQALFLGVALDQLDQRFVAAGAAQVVERLVVDREEAHRRAVFGRHVGDGRAVGQAQLATAGAVELDELADHAALAQHLDDVSTRSVAVAPSGSLPVSLKPITSGISM